MSDFEFKCKEYLDTIDSFTWSDAMKDSKNNTICFNVKIGDKWEKKILSGIEFYNSVPKISKMFENPHNTIDKVLIYDRILTDDEKVILETNAI